MRQTAWVLNLRISTLNEWNHLFDERMKPLIVPQRRGRAAKVTADMVRLILEAAQDLLSSGRSLRIKSFTRSLATERGIVLSAKTVGEILLANGLHKAHLRRRRRRFYQSLCQKIPNGLLSIDGSEFTVWLGDEPFKFNVELAVDVMSFAHTAYSISESETTEELLKVLEGHRRAWGSPLGIVCDHDSANLSHEATAYLEREGIELVPAGPANPKGNGSSECAFGQMKGALGRIQLDPGSPRRLAQSVLQKLIALYVHMRNETALTRSGSTPEAQMSRPVGEAERDSERQRLKAFQRARSAPADEQLKVDRLHWLIEHYGLRPEPSVIDRAERCIKAYEIEAIREAEEAFVKAVNRKAERLSLPYFFGILKRVQQQRDDEAYRRYCHDRYNYQAMKEAQRRREQQLPQPPAVTDLVAMLQQAVCAPVDFVKEVALRQARRMALALARSYRYVGALKKQIADALGQLTHLSLAQKQQAWELVEEFLSPQSREQSVTLKP